MSERDAQTRDERPQTDDRGPSEGAGKPGATCDLCGGTMIDRHCKLTCVRCGYQRDCSDP